MRLLPLLLALASGDDTKTAQLLDPRTGAATTIGAVAGELARRDVVFFGELHDSKAAHANELALTRELYALRPDLVLSFEMFERDVQGVVDDYLAGRIDEATFLAQSRPWPNYTSDYRPLIEFAKEHRLPVVAGCIPWQTAVRFGNDGKDPPPSAWVARVWDAPNDAYRRRFVTTMKGHVKDDGSDVAMERMYRSQCLRDDTMAEAIADALVRWRHRHACVVHFCGGFHSDFGQGTVARVVARVPSVTVGIVATMEPDEPARFDVKRERERANFILLVTASEAKSDPHHADEKKGDAPAK